MGWWQLFKDPQLLALLRTAVAQNQDINVAAQRVQEAQAQLTITAANLYPNVNAVFSAQYSQTNGQRSLITPKSTFSPNGLLALSYEFDFFGKYRSATAAARAQSLQATYAQETVMAAGASTASLYFQILELDNELAIARANLAVRRQSLDLVRARLYGGVGTLQDVRQAEQLVAQAQAAIPQIQRATAQAENALSVLLGGYPAPVPRGLPLRAQVAMPLVPAAGLPSELLERRPDIRASEESLIAANAQIGVARSLLFPQITLQAAAGAGTVQTAYLSLGQGYISILPQCNRSSTPARPALPSGKPKPPRRRPCCRTFSRCTKASRTFRTRSSTTTRIERSRWRRRRTSLLPWTPLAWPTCVSRAASRRILKCSTARRARSAPKSSCRRPS